MKYTKLLTHILVLGFLLGIHNGYVALWREGDTVPVRIFPCQARLLPEADRAALEKGIAIADDSQLEQFLEDYLS